MLLEISKLHFWCPIKLNELSWSFMSLMKLKIFLFIMFLLLSLTLFMAFFSKSDTENQPYTIVKKYEGFEIRDYPPVLYASVTKQGKMMDIGNNGFRDLAGFIFGANAESQKIAMTAPVAFEPTQGEENSTTMRFTMPADITMDNVPKPNSPNVRLHLSDSVRLAVIEFGGYASNEKLEKQADLLRKMLTKEGIKWKEPYRFFGYNAPYDFINRRNEVAFEL